MTRAPGNLDFNDLMSIFKMMGPLTDSLRFPYDYTYNGDIKNFVLRACIAPHSRGCLSAKALRDLFVKNVAGAGAVGDGRVTYTGESQQSKANGKKGTDTPPRKYFDAYPFKFHSTINDNSSNNDVDDPSVLKVMPQRKGSTQPIVIKMSAALDIGSYANRLDSCKVSYLLIDSPLIHPTVGRSADVETFMNFIPTHVMSRCVPYIDVEFKFERPHNEKLAAPGLLKFLVGADTPSEASIADNLMKVGHRLANQQNTRSNDDESATKFDYDYAGMEMFTSPQTLVSPGALSDSKRYKQVLDPFRPFLSLESFEVNEQHTVGFGGYRTATMSIKLHDRSRLSEIGDLIQPEIYTRTTMWVTYGWKHPVEQNNPYATFINGNMLVREEYAISNSSYSFDNSGQVTVTLQLYTTAAHEALKLRISAGVDSKGRESVDKIETRISELVKNISRVANEMGVLSAGSGVNVADIRAYQILNKAVKGEFPDLKSTRVLDDIKKLEKQLSKQKLDKQSINELVKDLTELYASDKGKYDFDKRRKSASDAIVSSRFSQLSYQNEKDPWLPQVGIKEYESHPFTKLVEEYNKEKLNNKASTKGGKFLGQGVCSFAKVISTFLVPQVISAGFDEVQVFFYAFNEKAGMASGTNIGNFPIDVPMFLDQFQQYVQQQGTENLAILDFLKFVIDSQLHDYRGIGYGVRSYYKPYDPKNKDAAIDEKKKDRYHDHLVRTQNSYGPFALPVIETLLETVPISNDEETDLDMLAEMSIDESARNRGKLGAMSPSKKTKRALRLHLYDKQLSPYRSAEIAMSAPNGSAPGHRIVVSSTAAAQEYLSKNPNYKDAKNFMENIGLIVKNSNGVFSFNTKNPDLSKAVTNEQLKTSLSQQVPTLTYGSSCSSIINVGLTTKQDPLLSITQMMKQSGRVNPQQPNGSGPGGFPITVIPGALTMTTIGCPLFKLMQRYFVDLNTGTTADNIYQVSKVTHSFAPGKFETSLTFVWTDAYGRSASYNESVDVLKELAKNIQQDESAKQTNENRKGSRDGKGTAGGANR
jgi:hypothetical protein